MPESLADLAATMAAINNGITQQNEMFRAAMARRDTGAVPASPPSVRTGESVNSSRGFSFAKMIGAMTGVVPQDQAKQELYLAERLNTKMYQGGFRPDRSSGSWLAPLWCDGFSDKHIDETMYREMKSMMHRGTEGADPKEMSWLAQKHFGGQKAAASPALSWVDQSVGGSLVGPATWGEPIDLLRSKEALLNAGASVVPLGPTGRLQYPRLTGATTGGWSGENTQQTPVVPATGALSLSAKKAISVVVFPGELLRFGSPATEALVRSDMMKTIALIVDKGLLDGQGSDNVPLGLATMGAAGTYGVNVISPTTTSQLAPQDLYEFLSAIEENAGEATAWIMRPKMMWAIYKSRASGDGTHYTNSFLFDWARDTNNAVKRVIAGLPVTTTPQVSKTRGSGTQTYVLCLNAPDYYVGLFGAIEMTQTDAGYALLSSDQVAVRALLHADGGMRHPAQVSFCDSLNFTVQ